MKCLLAALLLLLAPKLAGAQGENNMWAMAINLGLNFNTPGGPSFFPNSLRTGEACATVSDRSGNLLFYCTAEGVYDRTFTRMPNGNLIGNNSATQGAAIAKVPGSDSLYYVFSLESEFSVKNRLHYSIVDLRLNGGLGDIDPAYHNILLGDTLSERMCIAGNCEKQWVLVHRLDTSCFLAFELKSSKIIGSPVRSYSGIKKRINYYLGELKVSPDLKTLVMANYKYSLPRFYGADLYDFNHLSGVVSGYRVLDSNLIDRMYSVEFSTDSKKVYIASYLDPADTGGSVMQYDLTAGSPAAIAASKYTLAKGYTFALRRGPDDMIYVADWTSPMNFSRIREPDRRGALCNFQPNFLTPSFPLAGYCLTFGNRFVSNTVDTVVTTITRTICEDFTATITASGTEHILWNDGDTSLSKTITGKNALYWVYSRTPCSIRTDTFRISTSPSESRFSHMDTFACEPESIELKVPTGCDSFKWSDGSRSAVRNISGSMPALWLRSYSKCIITVDSFHITVKPTNYSRTIKDTTACFNKLIKLQAPYGYSDYLWNGGSTKPDTAVTTDGHLHVEATDRKSCRAFSGDYNLSFVNFSTRLRDTFTCNEDTIRLDATIDDPLATYNWDLGDTTAVITTTRPTSRFVLITSKGCTLVDTITVKGAFMEVYLGESKSVCTGEQVLLDAEVDDVAYMWSTGATTKTISASESGTYRVTVFKGNCLGKSEIILRFVNCSNCVLIPNAFTPNKDGINDKFKPILNCPPSSYQLKIMNRWGQELFTSSSPNDTWDGSANGTPLEGNTYFYMLRVKFEAQGDKEEQYAGDITLIR